MHPSFCRPTTETLVIRITKKLSVILQYDRYLNVKSIGSPYGPSSRSYVTEGTVLIEVVLDVSAGIGTPRVNLEVLRTIRPGMIGKYYRKACTNFTMWLMFLSSTTFKELRTVLGSSLRGGARIDTFAFGSCFTGVGWMNPFVLSGLIAVVLNL